MNSFNHYAYGDVGSWMYEVMAGIKIDESKPAFKNIIFQPITDKRIQNVKSSVETKNGLVFSQWKCEGGRITIVFHVPEKSTATIILDGQVHSVAEGVHKFTIQE